MRAYYAREDVLDELLQGMQRWHVKFVPGYAKSEWIYTEDPRELRTMIMQPLDLMEREPEREDYPYFRIDWARHDPAWSWDAETLWGYDFVIEKDSIIWQECFEAVLPVMDILEYFGVHYWCKYTGHHSLHLVVPAEVFPRAYRGRPLKDCYQAVYHRLMVFLNKRANQRYNEHDRHCPPGTNMPYSVNEDTGLLNYPLLREELAGFRPWHANIHLIKVRDFWRMVPQDAYGKAEVLLDEVMRPYVRQTRSYPPRPRASTRCVELSLPVDVAAQQAMEMLDSDEVPVRRYAAWALMLMGNDLALPALCDALIDEDADVRWFAAEAMLRFGEVDVLPKLLDMPRDDLAGASLVDFCVKHGQASLPALIEAFHTMRTRHKWQSLPVDRAIAHIGDASVPYLEALLDDERRGDRQKASDILSRLSGTLSADQGLELSCSVQIKERRYAARVLAWCDDPRAVERLVQMAEDKNAAVRKEAVKMLSWVDHPQLESVFERALADPNRKVRLWAQRGLDLVRALGALRA
jgi:HEAT repeat protein